MNKRLIRDSLRLMVSLLFIWLYIPHLLIFLINGRVRYDVVADLKLRENIISFKSTVFLRLVFFLHNDRYFRNLFYHRIGPVLALLIGWYRPGDRYFVISKTTKISPGCYCVHPFSTEINAESIGRNFSCRNNTTIGNKKDGDNSHRAFIGDNVTLGVSVCIIGPVHIGNNVTIGAGSVVVKDIPDNCIAVGNPCKPIKYLNNEGEKTNNSIIDE